MSERSEGFEQALRRLRAEYRAELPARLDVLEHALERARAGGSAEAALEARRLAHTLKGSSGSYGLSAVSEAVEAVEQALDELLAGPGDTDRSWEEIASALERARHQLAG
jgi:HPt (histidine-containing phosphotransfer) domain-containing protein